MGLKDAARASVVDARAALVDLSHRIHAHPELGYEEERAAQWLCEILLDGGLEVTAGVGGLPTAFDARAGSGDLHIAICAEYDCLPEIGHACGHNVIAAAAAGAGIALAPLADDLGITVRVIGTPAEEGGGGKIRLLDAGVFEGVHAAMMVHPTPFEVVEPDITAAGHFEVVYRGRAAHAAAAPERGINAGDAMVIAQTAIGLLRQHLPPAAKVHGFVEQGGSAVNVVPAHACGRWMVRDVTIDAMREVRRRVEQCFEAGALATGASLEIEDLSPDYAHMVHDHALSALYRVNAEALERDLPEDAAITFSTDMGNVSLEIPSIHPALAIDTGGAVNHQPEFAAACVNASADRAVVDGAIGMAWTTIDIAQGSERQRLLGA
jgi:amidohydrolase